MGSTLPLLSAVSPFDKTFWQVETSVRRTGEWVEFQWQRWGHWVWGDESASLTPPQWWGDILLWIARGLAILMVLWLLRTLFLQLQGWRRWFTQKINVTEAIQHPLSPDLTNVQDWLQTAAQAQAEGDYPAGCRALYMALLLRLQETGWIYQDRTYTDQEYLQRLEAQWALQARPTPLQATWRRIFQAHEVSYYGASSLSAKTFQACQQAYQTLDQELNRTAESRPSL